MEKPFSVLIVADTDSTRLSQRDLMSKHGFEVHVVDNGKEAIYLHRRGASFDLILLEIEMLDMNGVQVALELREMGIKSTIIGVTSWNLQSIEFSGAGLDHCVSKPLDVNNISMFFPRV